MSCFLLLLCFFCHSACLLCVCVYLSVCPPVSLSPCVYVLSLTITPMLPSNLGVLHTMAQFPPIHPFSCTSPDLCPEHGRGDGTATSPHLCQAKPRIANVLETPPALSGGQDHPASGSSSDRWDKAQKCTQSPPPSKTGLRNCTPQALPFLRLAPIEQHRRSACFQ